MERTLFRPLRDNPLGRADRLDRAAAHVAGPGGDGLRRADGAHQSAQPNRFAGFRSGRPFTIPQQRLYVIVASVVLLGALGLFLRHSKLGWALRACAQDPEAAMLQGISLNQTARLAMFIGAALAGVAGALTAPLVRTFPYMGHSVIVTAFIVIIVGGIGSLKGAVIAAILYAFIHTFVTTYVDGVVADITGLLLMLIVLVIKPTGLFGVRERA